MVGPIPPGINKFVFEADAPNTSSIPSSEVLGVTVILLTCSYDGRELVRVGYYVNNEYTDPELAENPPSKPVIEKIRRNILAEKPRVTRFAIKWCVFSRSKLCTIADAQQGLRGHGAPRVPAGPARGRRRARRRGRVRRRGGGRDRRRGGRPDGESAEAEAEAAAARRRGRRHRRHRR